MVLFDYKAIDPEGRVCRGRLHAANLADLEMRLQRLELDLVRGTNSGRRHRGHAVPRRELINFCFHLEQVVRAGIPILDGLADLRDSLEHRRFREIVAGLVEAIEGGQPLSEAMASNPEVFSRVFSSLVKAGELSGRLTEVLHGLGASLRWEDEIAAQARKVFIYPAFVSITVLGASLFLMLHLVPQLRLFVGNQELPPHTQLLFFLSDLLRHHWLAILLFPGLALTLLMLLLHTRPGLRLELDAAKLKLPVFGGILRKIILSRLASTLALLYASGIPILDAIRATREVVGNRAIGQGLEKVERLIGEGQNLTSAFLATGLFPPLVIRMLKIGESTGALDSALSQASYFFNRDVKESVEKIQVLIEPTLTLILGLLLGWVMLASLGPLYDALGRIQG